jgi:hypothetical protein
MTYYEVALRAHGRVDLCTGSGGAASDVVTVDGQYIGRDPDANVRAELRQD